MKYLPIYFHNAYRYLVTEIEMNNFEYLYVFLNSISILN